MNTITLFYVPVPNQKEAQNITETLLEKKLIACANVLNASSSYLFEQKIEHENEFILILKTLPALQEKAHAVIESLHSYSLPCILALQATASPEYVAWMQNELA